MKVGVSRAQGLLARILSGGMNRGLRHAEPRFPWLREFRCSKSGRGRYQCWFLLVTLLSLAAVTAHASTQYFYDRLGRLVTVINADGSIIDYQHDANGNVTAINRISSQTLSIVSFTPRIAHVGATITIYGTGFSTDAGQNAVTVGGALAIVSAATSTSLVISVPSGAETGRVGISAGGANATSDEDLVVRSPVLASFSPALVNPGSAVTLLGQNLNLVPGSTTIAVGSQTATVSSLTNTELVFAAPAASGYVSVNTSYGSATSLVPLQVIPAPIQVGNVVAVDVLVGSGEPQSLEIGQQNKYGLFEIDAAEGQFLSVQVSTLALVPSGGNVSYQVYSPENALLASGSISGSSMSIHLPRITSSGKHLLAFHSGTKASVQIDAKLEENPILDANGTSFPVSTSIASQSRRLIFTAAAGESFGFGANALSLSPSSVNSASIATYKMDGSAWTSATCYVSNDGCDINLSNVPEPGTYSVVVFPGAQASGALSATLTRDQATHLTAGTPISTTLSHRGANARLTFNGAAGAALGLQVTVTATTPSARKAGVTVLRPNGTTLSTVSEYGGYAQQLPNLPESGLYTVFVDPELGATASLTAKLIDGDVSGGAVEVDGDPQAVSGRTHTYFGFSASAGESIGIGISDLVLQNSYYNHVNVVVRQPNGTQIGSTLSCRPNNGGCDVNLTNLPMSGLYGVTVHTPYSGVANEKNLLQSYTATLSRDLLVSLGAGTPSGMSLSRRGQNGRYTFTGVAGAAMGLQVAAGATTPSNRKVGVTILKPDGTTLSTVTEHGGYAFQLASLPESGTYTVFVDPELGATTDLTAQLISAEVEGGAITVDGDPQAVSGRTHTYFGFSASAGENIGIGISDLTLQNSYYNYVNVVVRQPDGTQLGSTASCYPNKGGCDINLANLPISGLYGVTVHTPYSEVSNEKNLLQSYTATISRDLLVSLSAGTPSSMSLSRRGQNGRFTFTGTAGSAMGLQVAAGATTPSNRKVAVTVLKPDGTTLSTVTEHGGYAFQLASLPENGTYTVFVDPELGATTDVTAQLISAEAGGGAITVDGDPQAVSGRTHTYFGFSASAGENIGIGISDLVLQNSYYNQVNVVVRQPDGTQIGSTVSCYQNNGGCDVNLANLPMSGLYGVTVHTPYSEVSNEKNLLQSYTATVSRDLVVPLSAGTPSPVSLSRRGQNGRFTFTGVAGAAMGLQVAAGATTPSNRKVGLTVLKPDGTTLSTVTEHGGYAFQLASLPESGTYTVFVDPEFGARTDVTAQLISAEAGGGAITVDDDPQAVSGRTHTYFGFSAAAGENIGIGISDLVLQNSYYHHVNVVVRQPNGTQIGSTVSCYQNNGGCDVNLANLPMSGLYGVTVHTPYSEVANEKNLLQSFTATVSRDLVVPLSAGTPSSMSLSRRGQNARLTFNGSMGTPATLQITSVSTTPVGRSLNMAVYNPDGTTLSSGSATSSYTLNLNPPASGSYTLFLDPQFGAAATLQATQQ